MKKYGVGIPFTGYVYVEVEAENKEDAVKKAWEQDLDPSDAAEVEFHSQVTRGNVCSAVLNNLYVHEIKGKPTK